MTPLRCNKLKISRAGSTSDCMKACASCLICNCLRRCSPFSPLLNHCWFGKCHLLIPSLQTRMKEKSDNNLGFFQILRQLLYGDCPVADGILLFRTHLRKGLVVSIWNEYWIITKAVYTTTFVNNKPLNIPLKKVLLT